MRIAVQNILQQFQKKVEKIVDLFKDLIPMG